MSAKAELQPDSSSAVILVTAGYDHTIRFWDALSGMCTRTLQHPESQVNALAILPNKQSIVAAGHPQLKMYDIQTSTSTQVFEGHTGNVVSVGLQKDGRWMYSGSEDGTLKIWDLRAPRCQRDYDHRGPVNQVTLHPNQGELISCDQNGSIKIWDLAANACTHELVPEDDVGVRSVSVAADGSLLVAANSHGHCFVWRMANGKDSTDLQPVTRFQAHETYITKCILSPDAQKLATTSADHTVKIWNATNFLFDKTLSGHQRWVWDCTFSADSAYLITASSDQVARLWDLNTGDTIRHYTGHSKSLVCVALNDLP